MIKHTHLTERVDEELAIKTNSKTIAKAFGIGKKRADFVSVFLAAKTMNEGLVSSGSVSSFANIPPKQETAILEDLGYANITPAYIGAPHPITYPQAPTGNNLASVANGYTYGSGDPTDTKMAFASRIAAYTPALELLPNLVMERNNMIYTLMEHTIGASTVTPAGVPIEQFFKLYGGILGTASYSYANTYFNNAGSMVLVPYTGASTLANGYGVKITVLRKDRKDGGLEFRYDALYNYTASSNSIGSTLSLVKLSDVLATATTWAIGKFQDSTHFITSAQFLGVRPTLTQLSAMDNPLPQFATLGTGTPNDKKTAQEGGTQPIIGTLKRWSIAVEAKELSILGAVTRHDRTDLTKMGEDVDDKLFKFMEIQTSQSLNEDILRSMMKLGVTNAYRLQQAQGINLNLYVGKAGTNSKALSAFSAREFVDVNDVDRTSEFPTVYNVEEQYTGDNYMSRQRKLVSRLLAAKYIIGVIGRWGMPDFVVTNMLIATAIEDATEFTPAPFNHSLSADKSLTKRGSIYGLDLYIDQRMSPTDNRILVGRRGGEADPGLKFFTYDIDTRTVPSEATMDTKHLASTRYAILPAGYNPELQYLTFCVQNDFGDGIWS